MIRNLTHYFFALIVLVSSALMYDAYTKRWLQPPEVLTIQVRERDIVPDDTLGDLFPDGAWQRGLCKRLQTADGELLFENWEQTSGDQWRLWPITLIVGRGTADQTNPEPIILKAVEGAEIRFAASLNMMSGDAPPIQRGRMIGEVEIHRPTVDPSKSPLLIRASNVSIDNRKVWTTDPITLTMGQTRMVGRDLTLHLAASATSSGGGGAASILDRMELIYLDELVIPLEANALSKSQAKLFPESRKPTAVNRPSDSGTMARINPILKSPASTPLTPVAAEAFLKLNCDGRVEYDFALDQLSLREHVVLQHHVPGVADDQFIADSLVLRFRDPQNRQITRSGPLDWLSHIDAQGSPAVIDLPSLESRIVADRIELDAIGGLLRAGGENGIEVRRGMVQAKLSQLAYQYDPAAPQVIGTIDTFGWGLVSLLDPESPLRELKWADSFKLQPVGAPQQGAFTNDMALRISGDVKARFSDGGDFRADAVDGVLRAVDAKETDTAFANQVTQPAARATLRPDRFQAVGNVRLNNSAVTAASELLAIFFVDEPLSGPNMIGGTGVSDDESQSNPANSGIRQWVAQPGSNSQPTAPVARPTPSVRGDKIAVKLHMNDDGVNVQDLSVAGNVKLIHSINAGGQMLPAELTGNELLLTREAGEDVLQLGSRPESPSRFDLGDGFFIGPQINIWPNDNIVRIEGAGQFQMPTAVLPQSLTGEGPGGLQWTQAPKCKWDGEMFFDGKTAVLTGGVDITAKLINQQEPWSVHMIGDQLELVFLDSLEIGNVQSLRGAAIQQVTLLQSETQPVLIQAEQFGADGVREARHVMQAPRLRLLPSGGGKLMGAGPGWVRSWMYSDSKGPLAMPDTEANDKGGSTKSRSLMGIHLVYHDSLQGDLVNKSLAFLRGVRVGVKPVADWVETFDAHQMDSISNGESTMDCDTLQITVAPGMENRPKVPGMTAPWELQARGGVLFRSRSEQGLVEGKAASAVYASQKDLFTIQGTPKRGATIRNTKPNGQQGPVLNMRTMSIRPKTLEFDMTMDSVISGKIPEAQNR